MSAYAEFRHRRAKRGCSDERLAALTKLREIEGDQTHYIIITCDWFSRDDTTLSAQQLEWKAKCVKCEADLKDAIAVLESLCHPLADSPKEMKKAPEAKPEDATTAEAEYRASNEEPPWENLGTRKRNKLINNARSYREYQDLCAAIKIFRKT